MAMAAEGGMIGQVLDGRYRLMRLIGSGGMGSVYEAEHILVGRKVAVKILLPSMAVHPKLVARFYNEARTAGMVGNRHITEVFDLGKTDAGIPYLVMELLEGRTLQQLILADAPLAPRRAVNVMLGVLAGLQAAHDAGVIHRDLKPENVFLARKDEEEIVKLLDFGISKLRARVDVRLTQTGSILGTPCYMSPEQALGLKDVSETTDVYSAGVMLFEMLTGQPPFEAEALITLLVKIITARPPTPTSLNPSVPQPLEDIVLKAMAQDRARRFRRAREFADALRAFMEGREPTFRPVAWAPAATAEGLAEARSRLAQTRTPGGVSAEGESAGDTGTGAGRRHSWVPPFVAAMFLTAAAGLAAYLLWGRAESTAGTEGRSMAGTAGAGSGDAGAVVQTTGDIFATPRASAPEALVAAAAAGTAVPSADTIRFQLHVTPPDARVYLDDAPLPPPPVDLRFPRMAVAHTVRAQADGFGDQRQVVAFSADVDLALALVPVPSMPDGASAPDAAVASSPVQAGGDVPMTATDVRDAGRRRVDAAARVRPVPEAADAAASPPAAEAITTGPADGGGRDGAGQIRAGRTNPYLPQPDAQ